ncbi:protein giant-like [Watersipora subatra]|uniref:protein giant-like n=1 Tax=Watersipora subatra TaxID=2589382 RepID=UPI00355AF7EB
MNQLADSSTYDKDASVNGESSLSDLDNEISGSERTTPNSHFNQAYRNINNLTTSPFINSSFALTNTPFPSLAAFNPFSLLQSANGSIPAAYGLDPLAMATALQSASLGTYASDSSLASSSSWNKYFDRLNGRKRRQVKSPSPTDLTTSSSAELLAVKKLKTMQTQPTSTSSNSLTEKKDDGYWDRRRKNNEAAKRSRDAKRMKEVHIAQKAEFLERENVELKAQISLLKGESANLQFLLFNNKLSANQAVTTSTTPPTSVSNLMNRAV